MSGPVDDSEEILARKRVEQNPSDLKLRFQLGRCLVKNRRYKEAIVELQKAKQHPGHRRKAMQLLAASYEVIGLLTDSELIRKQIDRENCDNDGDSDEDGGLGGVANRPPTRPIAPSGLGAMEQFTDDEKHR